MAWGIQKLGLTKKELNRYSMARALLVLANPLSAHARKVAGFELDLSEQVKNRDNRETDGILIPQEVLDHEYRLNRNLPRAGTIMTDQVLRGMPPVSHLQKRAALTAGTAATAGNLVDTELHSVITVLVENTLALQNVPSYTVMGDPVYFPRQTGRPIATWGTEGVKGRDFANAEFSNVTGQTALNGLSGRHFALLTIGGVKYLAFEDPTAADAALLNDLKIGNKVEVYSTAGVRLQTYTIGGAFDASNNRNRIQVNSNATASGLADGTQYRLSATHESNPTYDRVSFAAKHLKCNVPITRTLLIQAQDDPDDLIRFDVAIGYSKALDSAMFYGLGSSNDPKQPQGVKGTTDIVQKTYAAGSEHEDILDFMAEVGVNNIPTNNIKFFTSWRYCHNMKVAQKLGLYSEVPIIEDGMIEEVPVEVSSQIVGTTGQRAEAFYADWNESALVFWQDLEINIDPYSKLDQGIVQFIGTMICDFNVTRPKAFARHGA